ncbi:hypothetical protein TIFTF001_020830 [Ficus carica]|uniref:Uncharacterized protein n=1 Tax=Ficus carica TaxID=3494 RepID=A0AA88DBC7_FICCA|nr:hypothetical protein TIFTF001_020830 [Ficus carica]
MPEKRFRLMKFQSRATEHRAPTGRQLHTSRISNVLPLARHLFHISSKSRARHILGLTTPSIFVNGAWEEREREEKGGREEKQ